MFGYFGKKMRKKVKNSAFFYHLMLLRDKGVFIIYVQGGGQQLANIYCVGIFREQVFTVSRSYRKDCF